MQIFRSSFELIVASYLDEITNVCQYTASAESAIEQYVNITRSSLAQYDHHQGIEIDDNSIISRFFYETAILHVATLLLKFSSEAFKSSHKLIWPIESPDSLYSWCEIDHFSIEEHLRVALESFKNCEEPQLTMIDLCDRVLSQNSERFIGEYYTPLNIVEHLIDISQFDPADLFLGKKVVDPACGGGMILASIVLKTIAYAKDKNISDRKLLVALTENVFGYDIQPFAIALCKTVLFSIAYPLQSESQEIYQFNHLFRLDPLSYYQEFWRDKLFDFIIGNPPFMSVKKSQIDYIEAYKDVIFGHPNLYVLFLWWSVKSAKENGIVSLLLPQSMLVGQYYKSIRDGLQDTTTVLNITRMVDRKGIVGDADQQMMAISLRVGSSYGIENQVALRVTRNGNDIPVEPVRVSDNLVIQSVNSSTVWIVSDDKLDYDIEDSIRQSSKHLGYYDDLFQLNNGGFVWNQNKEHLSATQGDGYIPLVSAASISAFDFNFPYDGPHSTKYRSFSRVVGILEAIIRNGPALLIQRTTPRKVGRRLVCSIPEISFFQEYDQYFLENHINSITATGKDLNRLYGLLGWLNSDLINFIFQLRNGTTQVSLYELRLIPANIEVLDLISPIAKNASETTDTREKHEYVREINDKIFDSLGFADIHRQRINAVLSRKENHTN